MRTLRSDDDCLSRPYAIAAAVGSLMIRSTLRPAMEPASARATRRRRAHPSPPVAAMCGTHPWSTRAASR
eukprot:534479-Prymnesium_polylepis.1